MPGSSRDDRTLGWLAARTDALTAALDRRDRAADGAPVHRWAAARRAVVELARARLGCDPHVATGALFADAIAGASAVQQSAWDACREFAAPTNAPPDADCTAIGAAYPALLAPSIRKQHGAWFTAAEIAQPTACRTLAPLLAAHPPRICDPAVGAGSFLLAAVAELRRADVDPATALGCVHGLDLDPTAAHLAAAALFDATDGALPLPAIDLRVRCGDGLLDGETGVFDVVLGNPPWETLQLARGESRAAGGLTARILELRLRYRFQGRGKLYTYRLFVERALQLLRPGGRLGLVVPSSLYADRDAAPLRRILFDECAWEWLFAFENRRRLFAIDGRYRFAAIVAAKGGRTDSLRAAFLRDDPREWAVEEPAHLPYRRADVRGLSRGAGTLLELRDARDLDLLQRLHAHGVPLCGDGGVCRWRQGDHNMTSDRHRFVDRVAAERDGYRQGDDGRWRRPGAPTLRTLYQGGMVFDLHPNAGGYAGGTGRAVRWRAPHRGDRLEPQYLIADDDGPGDDAPARVVLRALSNATNERTAIACLLGREICGNSLGVLVPRTATTTPIADAAFVAGVLASFVWDWALRQRLAGTNLNGFVLADTVVPRADRMTRVAIAAPVLRLCAVMPWQSPLVAGARDEGWSTAAATIDTGATESGERRHLRAELEVAVARAFGLSADDLRHILRDCDLPIDRLADRRVTRRLDPKGFWRVDRLLPPELRLPSLVLALADRGGSDGEVAASRAADEAQAPRRPVVVPSPSRPAADAANDDSTR